MLFKFKSKATADLIMLEPDARRLLQIMLGDEPVKGIVLWQDLPAVLARLDEAVSRDEALRKDIAQKAAHRPSEDTAQQAPLPPVRLAQRAQPMQQMIRRCIAQESDIVWGV